MVINMRTINADALVEEIITWQKDLEKEYGRYDSYVQCLDVVISSIEHAPTVTPWRRVEEPPKEHMWCFVYTDEPEMIMPIRIAFYVASCTGKGSWYHYESGEDIDDEVDYWMPMYIEGPDVDKDLPWPFEPPKEDAR